MSRRVDGDLPPALSAFDRLLERQQGVVTRRQAYDHGISDSGLKAHVRAGRWQNLLPRVYAAFNGPISRQARQWAGALYAGHGAALSHESAADVHGIAHQQSWVVHVTIPVERRVRRCPWVIPHRARRFGTQAPDDWTPRVTTVEQTVIDLTQTCQTLDDAYAWIARACSRKKTTPERLLAELCARRKVRWLRDLTIGLGHVEEGAHSPLEIAYARGVERRHGLPVGVRQRRTDRSGRQDVFYAGYGLTVELDGRAFHPEDRRMADTTRDNASIARGEATMRFGWVAVKYRPCCVAIEVAGALKARGWNGSALRSCGAKCPIPT